MKKIIVLVSILILSSLVFAEDCEIALPRYGRIQCDETSDEEIEKFEVEHTTNTAEQPVSIFEHTCISDCRFDATSPHADVSLNCPPLCVLNWKIYKNGDESITPSISVEYDVGDSIRIEAYCCGGFFRQQVTSDSWVQTHFDQIMLREAWAGSLPDLWLAGTEKCILNEQVDKYRSNLTDAGNYIDPTKGDSSESKPSSTYSSIDDIPGNMRVTENYVFVKDWQTGIAGLSLTYDKSNNAYWCGGVSGRRKIYQVNEINFQGNCYAIPQSVALDSVECCVPADCTYKGAQYTCNPDTWKCEETRWCNSDLECQQTFSSGICENRGASKVIVSWGCDTSKHWGDYAGTCIKSERNVQQCPRDCTSEEYYNEEEGICKPLVVLIDCPSENCCKEGGDYKPKGCATGMECCIVTGATLGKCKPSCAPPPPTTSSETTGFASSLSGEEGTPLTTAPGLLFPVIILVIVGGAAFAAYYFLYMQPKQQQPIVKQTPPTTGPVCGKCGTPIKQGAKFCKGCGNRL